MGFAIQFYMMFGLIWAGFCMGSQICVNSGEHPSKIAAVAAANLLLWPISVAMAIHQSDR